MRRVILPFAALLSLSGCYTVLRHPRVDADAQEPDTVVVRSDCAACHSDWELDRYGYVAHQWYPVYGPWPRWYYDPWWRDVVVADRQPASAGVQVEQSAGLPNDRGEPAEAPGLPGVWIPGTPSGTGVTLPVGPRPQAGGPPDGSPSSASGSTGHLGSPTGSPNRPGTSTTTPAEPQPPEQLQPPERGSVSTPATRSGDSTSNPRGSGTSGDSSKQPAEAGRQATPSTKPPAAPSPPASQAQPSQGRGMTNDRGEPKP